MTIKIEIHKNDPLRIQVNTEDYKYLKELYKYFSEKVSNYYFMPQYRSGGWDGTVSMFNKLSRTIPYGLFFDYLKFHKEYENPPELNVSPAVKRLFIGPKVKPIYNLSLKPYKYQIDCVDACLKHSKGIIRTATAGGKSLMIAFILDSIARHLKSFEKNPSIIIVPTKDLMQQFVENLLEYGIDESHIGTVFAKSKQFDKNIVISTWQSLSRRHDKLQLYNSIFVDEVHGAKSHEVKKIVSKAKNANYRLGFTGTLHTHKLDNWNVKAYLGPVLRNYSAGELADLGHIAKCCVNVLNVEYENAKMRFNGEYNDVKELLFTNNYRLELLLNLVQNLDSTVLLLVGKVEKEGIVLRDYFEAHKARGNIDKEVVFLSGTTSTDEEREFWRQEAIKRNDLILIATYGIFQLGINIPPLKYLILAAPFKSKIRVLQSIGRALRKHSEKIEGAQIFDIVDVTKYFEDHGLKRLRHYYSEKFDVKEFVFHEGDEIDISQVKGQLHLF